jgi:hypothetical protein
VYASVRVRGLTRFHVALVRCVLSESNGNGGQTMRRAGHARLRRALGGSVPHRFPMRLVEIDRLLAVHGRARAGCPPQSSPREEVFISPSRENPKSLSAACTYTATHMHTHTTEDSKPYNRMCTRHVQYYSCHALRAGLSRALFWDSSVTV